MESGISVSVIIPFYKYYDWLIEAVQSVLVQTFDNFEIVIVNDGSREDIKEDSIVYTDSRIKYFTQENGGAAKARNKGIREAKGEYIAFLDSDDLWTIDKLSTQIKLMVENNATFSYTNYETFGDGIEHTEYRMIEGNEEFASLDHFSRHIATPTVVVKKTLLEENNLMFDETMRYGQDGNLWMKLLLHTNVLVINKVLARVRIRGKNTTKKARAHIMIDASNWAYKKSLNVKTDYPHYVKTSLNYTIFVDDFLRKIEKRGASERTVELLARVMFFPRYIVRRIYRRHKNTM